MSTLTQLKQQLNSQLIEASQLTRHQGIPTHIAELDQFLLWGGLPKGDITLFKGLLGQGSSSLWLRSAQFCAQQKRWCAWIHSPQLKLCPWALARYGCDLSRLLSIGAPRSRKQLIWAFGEILSHDLFDLVGCDVSTFHLTPTDLLRLKRLARQHCAAVVLLDNKIHAGSTPFYALVMDFTGPQVCIERALHRPTPYTIQRRDLYADFMPQPQQNRTSLHC